MNKCIICDKNNEAKSIEHIVSESFGNKDYVLEKGNICDECNQNFSKFEDKALSNSIFVIERARSGIPTKKGKNVKGKIQDLVISGDENFRESYISIKGLNKDNFKNYNPDTKTGSLIVAGFDKSEVAVSRLLLKMGIESLFKSRKEIFNKYDFTDLKNYLKNETNDDWGFITAMSELGVFESIPRYTDKYNLKKIRCELRFQERSEIELLFKFHFMGISLIINLLNRELNWSNDYKEHEDHVSIHPSHFNKKIKVKAKNNNSSDHKDY